MKPGVSTQSTSIQIGERLSVSFHRTLRIPDDGGVYPLPPSLGYFPIHRIEDFAERVPEAWRETGGYFIPMYQREALWLSFSAAYWKPNALQIGVGQVCAVSGKSWSETLSSDPQNYIVCPNQPWLDGINAGDGYIRQFVAVPLGSGLTVEGQITGEERHGGIQLRAYEPRPGVFPDEPPAERLDTRTVLYSMAPPSTPTEMGLGAGGRMKQKIYPDPHGIDVWDIESAVDIHVQIVNSEQYKAITGQNPPPTPIDAATYTQYGFPWFDLYDEHLDDVAPPDNLANVESVDELAKAKGDPLPEDKPVKIPVEQVKTYWKWKQSKPSGNNRNE